MKTSKLYAFFLMISAIFLIGITTSCDTTDLIEPTKVDITSDQFTPDARFFDQAKLKYELDKSTIAGNEVHTKITSRDRRVEKFAIYQLIDFEMERVVKEMVAVQVNPYVKGELHPYTYIPVTGSESIILKGYGKGWSEEFGMSFIRIDLNVDPGTMKVTGTLWCEFRESESTLVFELSGSGPLQTIYEFDGPHSGLLLNSTLTRGTGEFKEMQMNAISYFLNASVLQDPEVKEFSSYLMTVGEMSK